jgi:hypothetical protein
MVGDADIDHQAAKDAHPALVTFHVPSEYNSDIADYQVHSLGHAAEKIAALLSP